MTPRLARWALLLALRLGSAAAEEAACKDEECRAQDAPGPQKDNMLMQAKNADLKKMQARATQSPPLQASLLQADEKVATILRQSRANPMTIAATVQKGLQAVMNAVKHFMMDPPQIRQGLDVLGAEMLEAVQEPLMKEVFMTYQDLEKFREEWMKFFDSAEDNIPSVSGNITLFQDEGKPETLIMAISGLLLVLSDGVARFVPHRTAQEVVKYVDAVADMFLAIGTSWSGFESGQEAKAIEDLYFALQRVLDDVIPKHIQDDATYKLIIGTIDGVLAELSETVNEFRKQILEGGVCWKVQEARMKKRPSVCTEGFYWNGDQFCLPEPTAEGASLLERTTTGKVDGASQGKVPIPDGAMVALCDESTEYTEKIGHWCYAPCPEGTAPSGLQCKTVCKGEFPADDGGMMCGHNPGVIAEVSLQMMMSFLNAVGLGNLIAGMTQSGVDSKSLSGTMNAFVDMAKPFAYATCRDRYAGREGSPAPTGPTRKTEVTWSFEPKVKLP